MKYTVYFGIDILGSCTYQNVNCKVHCIFHNTFSLAKRSVASITRKTLPKAVCILHKLITGTPIFKTWVSKTSSWKYHNSEKTTEFGRESNKDPCRPTIFPPVGRIWYPIPTPLNLRWWKLRTEARCDLCSSTSPTTLHILNACPVASPKPRQIYMVSRQCPSENSRPHKNLLRLRWKSVCRPP